ncbi:MAG: cytochrome C oxidase subunit IV family protein [Deltaproteobacteria bacterium]|nr:cytochrome C oxidase subunit IV family protein [Deltaproteobacteria bacterium]
MHTHDHRRSYKFIWIALLLLTAITVWTSYHDYGVFNIIVAMGIASLKASLVALYFMHLRYDNRLNQVVFASSLFFLLIFIGLTAADELFRPATTKVHITNAPTQTPSAKIPVDMAVDMMVEEAGK